MYVPKNTHKKDNDWIRDEWECLGRYTKECCTCYKKFNCMRVTGNKYVYQEFTKRGYHWVIE